MKVIINLTVFENDFTKLIKPEQILEQLKYSIIKYSIGLHKNSSREHHHIIIIAETNTDKILKYLDKKIHQIKKDIGYQQEIRVSFKYETGLGSKSLNTKDYDENTLGYAYKEYDSIEEIPMDEQIGLTKEEIEELWDIGHKIYIKAQQIQKQKEEEKKQEETLYHYIDNQLKLYSEDIKTASYQNFKYLEPRDKIQQIIQYILRYFKENQKKFSINRLKDQAINYLYFSDLITDLEIINLINI